MNIKHPFIKQEFIKIIATFCKWGTMLIAESERVDKKGQSGEVRVEGHLSPFVIPIIPIFFLTLT